MPARSFREFFVIHVMSLNAEKISDPAVTTSPLTELGSESRALLS